MESRGRKGNYVSFFSFFFFWKSFDCRPLSLDLENKKLQKSPQRTISSLAPSLSFALSIAARYDAASGATLAERSAAAAAAAATTSLPASDDEEPSPNTSAADAGTTPPSLVAENNSARWQKFPRFASSSALVLAARSLHLKSVSEVSGRDESR